MREDGVLDTLIKEQKELTSMIDGICDFKKIGRNDMPEGTIITESYFRDSLVPVMTKQQVESIKNESK